jgi:hypothetical protein
MFIASNFTEKSTSGSKIGRGRIAPRRSALRYVVGAALAALVLSGPPSAFAVVVTDDFSDLNDTANPAWTRLDGLIGSTGQTWDASTGVYRMYAPSNGFESIGAVGSHVGPTYTDVRVSMDLVEFYTTFAPPHGPEWVQITARSNGSNDLLGLTGYAYGYDPLANANAGEMVLYRNDVNDPTNDIGSQRVTLDQNKDYRIVLEVIGNTLHGQVSEIGTGTVVAESFADISAAANVYTSGISGVFGYSQSPFETQFGIDNFRVEEALAGDYNRDGSVGAADYVVWRKTLGAQSPDLDTIGNPPSYAVVSLGDMRANGAVSGTCGFSTENCEVIDQADYAIWRSNFGDTVSGSGFGFGSGGAVPEPAGAALAFFGIIGLWFCRRHSGR